ncbi:hypothetical protein PCE1_004660 [Barthelona sp. PCE]
MPDRYFKYFPNSKSIILQEDNESWDLFLEHEPLKRTMVEENFSRVLTDAKGIYGRAFLDTEQPEDKLVFLIHTGKYGIIAVTNTNTSENDRFDTLVRTFRFNRDNTIRIFDDEHCLPKCEFLSMVSTTLGCLSPSKEHISIFELNSNGGITLMESYTLPFKVSSFCMCKYGWMVMSHIGEQGDNTVALYNSETGFHQTFNYSIASKIKVLPNDKATHVCLSARDGETTVILTVKFTSNTHYSLDTSVANPSAILPSEDEPILTFDETNSEVISSINEGVNMKCLLYATYLVFLLILCFIAFLS